MMKIRNRIKELRRVRAADLIPNMKNWRQHPQRQREALKGILAEVGYADALIARETDDGDLVLVDGHLRAETTPDQMVPVLVLDVTEHEADKLLLSMDPLSAMADVDPVALKELIEKSDAACEALKEMHRDLADAAGLYKTEKSASADGAKEVDLSEIKMDFCCPECGFEFNANKA
jgi:hypothetical protein